MTTRPAPDADGRAERSVGELQAQRLLASAMLVLLPILLIALVWTAQRAIFLLFAGMLFAALLDAAMRGLVGIAGLPRKWAYAAVVATLLILLTALVWLGGNALVANVGDLYATLQEQVRRLGDVLDRVEPGVQQGGRDTLLTTLHDLGSILRGGGVGPGSMALSVLGAFANAFIVFCLGLFLALEPGLYKRGAVRLFPPERRGRIDEALHLAGRTLRWWLVGKLMSMTVIFVLTLAGLLLVGYPLALPAVARRGPARLRAEPGPPGGLRSHRPRRHPGGRDDDPPGDRRIRRGADDRELRAHPR